MISLGGAVAVITGGSRGIGAATAAMLARAGADVVINYVSHEDRAAEVAASVARVGRRAALMQGDIAEAAVARDIFARAEAEFGKVTIVVNNAGIWTYGAMGEFPEDIWDRTMEVNIKGTFNVCNAAVCALERAGGGTIINVASTAGQRGEAFHAHYAASKGAVLAFTRSLAVELAPRGITVNAVAPGWVDTEMNSGVFADEGFRRRVEQDIPLRRIASAEDVAGVILFLASPLARHLTGTTVNVNGGSVLC